jgi:signal peptidase I
MEDLEEVLILEKALNDPRFKTCRGLVGDIIVLESPKDVEPLPRLMAEYQKAQEYLNSFKVKPRRTCCIKHLIARQIGSKNIEQCPSCGEIYLKLTA